jgi:hydroxymethylbilane synthase
MRVGARISPLSQAQFREVQSLFPHLNFTPVWVKTTGDLDQHTSLRTLEKTDFFTRELDLMVLHQEVRIAIHSAKDLPDPLPLGLRVVHLTKGIDPRDSLVFSYLPKNPLIATSSVRREILVRTKWPEARFVDLRGTIAERLDRLNPQHPQMVDGVVVAEAALIRLGLTHLQRHIFEEQISPLQGKLAIVARVDDLEIASHLI